MAETIIWLSALFSGLFFALAGFNRIFKTRLMMLPSAPVSFEVSKQNLD